MNREFLEAADRAIEWLETTSDVSLLEALADCDPIVGYAINGTKMTEYELIAEYYGERTARRSQVPLINHIKEGLVILKEIGASENAMRAYCLHPMLQGDAELIENFATVAYLDPMVVALAMEYRSVANEFLSGKIIGMRNGSKYEVMPCHPGIPIRLSPLKDVNDILIADKVQNRKDFITYHLGTHERSAELDLYFKMWMERLCVSDEQYQSLCEAIDKAKANEHESLAT
ncbi:MAG TPA: hypothetical protein VFM18_18165 [Methanosarcina sp.]|nr:hypothetical protein [Methanosarcina sp.]